MRRNRNKSSPKKSPRKTSHNSKAFLITNPEKIIDESCASSNPDLLNCLFDNDRETFWKSSLVDQSDDKIWVEFKIRQGLKIDQIKLRVDKEDFSFIPSHISVLVGQHSSNLKVAKEINLTLNVKYEKPILILSEQTSYFRVIMLKMDRMIHGGEDCKLRGLQIHATTDPLKLALPQSVPTGKNPKFSLAPVGSSI